MVEELAGGSKGLIKDPLSQIKNGKYNQVHILLEEYGFHANTPKICCSYCTEPIV